jgi:hypothetical protein
MLWDGRSRAHRFQIHGCVERKPRRVASRRESGMNPGFLSAWLASPYAQVLIDRLLCSSVIAHIDRTMLGSVPVTLMRSEKRAAIGALVLKATRFRKRASVLERACIDTQEQLVEPESTV